MALVSAVRYSCGFVVSSLETNDVWADEVVFSVVRDVVVSDFRVVLKVVVVGLVDADVIRFLVVRFHVGFAAAKASTVHQVNAHFPAAVVDSIAAVGVISVEHPEPQLHSRTVFVKLSFCRPNAHCYIPK